MALMFVFSAVIVIPVWLYMYYAAKRAVTLWVSKEKKLKVCIIALLVSSIIMIPSLDMWGKMATWSIAVVHLLVFTLITQLINYVIKKVSTNKYYKTWDYIYRLMLIPIVCVIVTFTYGYYHMIDIVETDYDLTTDKQISESGYRTAVIADIHYGNSVHKSLIESTVNELNSKDIDMLLLCGDIVDESTSYDEMQELFEELGKVKTTYGIFYVYGNHDRALYSSNPPFTIEQLESAIKGNNITILKDQVYNVTDDCVLIGREDSSQPRKSMDELIGYVDLDDYIIVMDHQPREFDEKAAAGVDLTVSGHTHGGQIFPAGYISSFFKLDNLTYGFKAVDNMNAIVTSGLSGWGYPIRTQSVSEYVILNIQN